MSVNMTVIFVKGLAYSGTFIVLRLSHPSWTREPAASDYEDMFWFRSWGLRTMLLLVSGIMRIMYRFLTQCTRAVSGPHAVDLIAQLNACTYLFLQSWPCTLKCTRILLYPYARIYCLAAARLQITSRDMYGWGREESYVFMLVLYRETQTLSTHSRKCTASTASHRFDNRDQLVLYLLTEEEQGYHESLLS